MNKNYSLLGLLTLMFFVLISSTTFSQGTVRGFVKDKISGEPVLFANVVLKGTNFGALTDVTGFYSLSKVPSGDYVITVGNLEYQDQEFSITIEDGKVKTQNFSLARKVTEIGAAEVSVDKQEQRNQIRMSVESIRPSDFKKIPSFGGQKDIVQVIGVLPGVISTGDQGGQLYIRGGSPVQNMVLLDGMIIYNAFHSIGLFSVFDTDIIANADVYTGGFNAQFGGRISSVMDITTRDGNKSKLSGKIGASPFGAKILLEGPLKKISESSGGISYILSAKQSYLEQSSKTLYSYIDEDGLPFNFTDVYGKISFGGKGGSKFNLYGFGFTDDVSYQGISDLSWGNFGGGGNFVVVPPGSPVLINGHFAASQYEIKLGETDLQDRYSRINGFNFGLDFKYVLGENDILYGVEVIGRRTDFRTFNPLGVIVEQTENTTEFGGYFVYKISKNKFLVEPSLRIQYYSSIARFSPEPRIGVKYKATERLRLKGSAGLYSQNLISTNSDRDVVNLFYGFLSGPTNLQNEFITDNGDIKEIKHTLQTAAHYIAGFEFDLTEKINVNVEGYIKDFTQLTNANRNKLFPDNITSADVPDYLKKDFIIETGIAKGVDFMLKYEDKYTNVWLVYSLGDVDRWEGTRWYDPVFDRRHNVNVVASHRFGKDHSYEASVRWNLGSGLPFTQTQGYYQPPNITDGIATDYVITNNDELGISLAGLNEGRLPAYHRLDASVTKMIKFSESSTLELNAGITNIYSRANVFYINRVTSERVDQLPFLPSIGMEYSF